MEEFLLNVKQVIEKLKAGKDYGFSENSDTELQDAITKAITDFMTELETNPADYLCKKPLSRFLDKYI